MSFDDELRARMKDAAQAAGSGADPSAASAYVAANAARAATQGAAPLKLVGGLGAIGLVAGAVLGATVLRPSDDGVAAAAGPAIEVSHGSTFDCPGGAVVGSLQSGDRVFVVARDEAGEWSAVRDPRALDVVVWIPAAALDPDGGATVDVPVRSCAEAAVSLGSVPSTTTTTVVESSSTTSTTVVEATTTVAATVASTVAPTVAPTTPPTTAPDTQAPTLQVSSNQTEIYDTSWPECANEAQLSAFASDNRGVVAVTGTYSGLPGSPLTFSLSGGTWRANFGPFSGLAFDAEPVIAITVRARDAAGNLSNPVVVNVQVNGTCVI